MTSIPHYEDLSVQEILDTLDLKWVSSEKLDGTSLEAGIDANGQFFSKRKGGEPIYDVEDWSNELWAQTFRSVHVIAGMAVEALLKENAIGPGNTIGFEIIENNQPNTIEYIFSDNTHSRLIVTNTNWTPNTSFYTILENMVLRHHVEINDTFNGWERISYFTDSLWKIHINPLTSMEWIQKRLLPSSRNVQVVLESWLPNSSRIPNFTNREILDLNLAQKHPKTGDKNWNEFKKELAAERLRVRKVFESLVLLFKEAAYRVIVNEGTSIMSQESYREGAVVQTPTLTFKLVDRSEFSRMNNFTHRVKYAIVGGRRPSRPSFLSRTKDWPKEARLARLKNLMTRYHKIRYLLRYNGTFNGRNISLLYDNYVNHRTLKMFCDTKKRIEDGR